MASSSDLRDLGPTRDPLIGLVLAERYRLVRKLGHGGMGSVYEGLHEMIGKRVAVKLLHAQLAGEADIVARFLNEARAAATLRHPHIVEALDVGRAPDGTPFIVLEFLEGESLAHRLREGRHLSPARAVALLRPVVSALALAHRHGIVHRDLKPDNLFLSREADGHDRIKVVDFGISKIADGTGAGVTETGQVIGTPSFMAPELMTDSSRADARSDIFALGVVLYQALSGARPFARGGVERLAEVAAKRAPDRLRDRAPEVPPDLDAVVERCLEYDPTRRFASMDELGAALDALGPLSDLDPGEGESITRTTPALSPAHGPPSYHLRSFPTLHGRRRWWGIVALATLAVGLGVGGAWTFAHRRSVGATGLVVAVAPFYGSDPEAITEAQGMRNMAERALRDTLRGEKDLSLSPETTDPAPRSEDEARALAQKLGAAVIVWGEALVFRGETEVQAYVTPAGAALPLAADLSCSPLRINLTSVDGLDARKTKAQEIARRAADAVALWRFAKGETTHAITALDHVEAPDSRSVLLKSILLEHSGHARPGIEEVVRDGLARFPDDAALHDRLGHLLLADGDSEHALLEGRRAVALQPRVAAFHQGLADVLRARGDLDGGAAELSSVLSNRPANLHETVVARYEARRQAVEAQAREALPVLRQLEAELSQEPFFTRARSDVDAAAFLDPLVPWEGDLAQHLPVTPGTLHLPEALEKQLQAWDAAWPKHAHEINWDGVDLAWLKELRRFGTWDITAGASPLAKVPDLFPPTASIPNMLQFQRFAKLALLRGMLDGDPEPGAEQAEQLAWLAYQTHLLIGGAIASSILRIEVRAHDEWVAEGHPCPNWKPMSEANTLKFRRVLWGVFGFADPLVPREEAAQVFDSDAVSVGRCCGLMEMALAQMTVATVGDPDLAPWEAFARGETSRPGLCRLSALEVLGKKHILPLDRTLLEVARFDAHENDDLLDAPADDLGKVYLMLFSEGMMPLQRLMSPK